jgi:hypothetical protein
VPDTVTVIPGQIPAQYFSFGGGMVGAEESSLGWVSGGINLCPRSALGDEVDAYVDASTTPSMVRFYRYSAPYGACNMNGQNLSPSASGNWSGPIAVAQGAFTRLAGGSAGLFLLSGDALKDGFSTPTAIDIRHYSLASHSFGPPTRLAVNASQDFDTNTGGGGLGENYVTGELAAVWPLPSAGGTVMGLVLSTDGGVRFSAVQDIANVGFGYAVGDNARVAVAANGGGFVTYEDAGGLHVADFDPIAAQYRRLLVKHGAVEVPVLCQAPTGSCDVRATLTRAGSAIASGHRTVRSGFTSILRLPLDPAARLVFTQGHGHLSATLKLEITREGASDNLTARVSLTR